MDGVLGVRSKFYWDCVFTKMTTLAAVRRVDRIDVDGFEALKQALSDEVSNADPSALPRGFQKGSAVVAVVIADDIDPALKAQVGSSRTKGEFAKMFFPVLVDAHTGEATYFKKTPLIGGVYYAKFRWLAERLSNPGTSTAKEPLSWMGAFLSIWMLLWAGGLIANILR